jgi:hypothetical protein
LGIDFFSAFATYLPLRCGNGRGDEMRIRTFLDQRKKKLEQARNF